MYNNVVKKFNEFLGEGFFVYDDTNQSSEKKKRYAETEGVFRVNGGAFSKLGGEAFSKVDDFTITFEVSATQPRRQEITRILVSMIEYFQGYSVDNEDDGKTHLIYFQSQASQGEIYLKGVDKVVSIQLSGQIQTTNSLLTSDGLLVSFEKDGRWVNLEGVITLSNSRTDELSRNDIITDYVSQHEFNSQVRNITIEGYVMNTEAHSFIFKALNSTDYSLNSKLNARIKWVVNGVELLNIDGTFIIYAPQVAFIMNGFTNYKITLVETL